MAVKIPVTFITGYLGSGKTTLVNRLLAESHGLRIAVLVNEFGAIGIDGDLITAENTGTQVIELANGCLCCVVSGEFREALEALSSRGDQLDHIVIEASGAADPTSVVKAFWGSPELTRKYRLDGVVCLVDAERFLQTSQTDSVAELQAAVADLLLLTKTDVASKALVADVKRELAELNPGVPILETQTQDRLASFLKLNAFKRPSFYSAALRGPDHTSVSHGGLTSIAVAWDGMVSTANLQTFFQTLVGQFGDQVVRTKALFHIDGESSPWLVQGVQNWIERSKGPRGYSGPNKLVILGRGFDTGALDQAIERLMKQD